MYAAYLSDFMTSCPAVVLLMHYRVLLEHDFSMYAVFRRRSYTPDPSVNDKEGASSNVMRLFYF